MYVAFKERIEVNGTTKKAEETVLNRTHSHCPGEEDIGQRKCAALEPHVRAFLTYSYEPTDSNLKQTTLFHNCALYAASALRFQDAKEKLGKAIEVRKKNLHSENRDLLESGRRLGLTYSDQGRYKETETIQREIFNITKAFESNDDKLSDILSDKSNLATTLRNLGQYEEAERLATEVRDKRTRGIIAE